MKVNSKDSFNTLSSLARFFKFYEIQSKLFTMFRQILSSQWVKNAESIISQCMFHTFHVHFNTVLKS